MLDIQPWMQLAVARLQEEFGPRLLFVGLQGSYRRGEARADSDIDILTVLDKLNVADLAAYRRVLRALPEGEKACGFTCGLEELLAWPPFELFQFAQDTDAYYGKLEPLLPSFCREDTIAGVRQAVSGLYHYTAYLYVSGVEASRAEALKGVYKNFFFAMQLVEYLRSGVYVRSQRELLARLSGDEAELLRLCMELQYYAQRQANDRKNASDDLFQLMLCWTGRVLCELQKMAEQDMAT